MKNVDEINQIMNTIPEKWRNKWCGGENGPCACMGCTQIGNRMIMYQKTTERKFNGDPEYIDEKSIPAEIYENYKITKDEYLLWLKTQ